MSAVIHGQSHKVIKHFRDKPAALAIYWIYASRTNHDHVAYPTLVGLMRDTGWGKTTCASSRAWLVEHKALEVVPDYTRPEWRDLPPKERAQKQNLDKSEYYRPTGYIEIAGVQYSMLYLGAQEKSDIEQITDVPPRTTSDGVRHRTARDITRRVPELNTIKDSELDSTEKEKEKESEAQPQPPMLTLVDSTKPPKRHPNQDIHDALLIEFGLKLEFMNDKADKPYWVAAASLRNFDVRLIPALYKFVQGKANVAQWKSWTVMSLPKYAPEFMRDYERHIPLILQQSQPEPEALPKAAGAENLGLISPEQQDEARRMFAALVASKSGNDKPRP